MMDWLNSNFYKDFGYGVIYPQLFPHHKRPGDAVQAGTLDWGKQKSQSWLKILDEKLIGPNQRYLCGDKITLADYMGAEMISLGGVIGCNYAAYRTSSWLGNMKSSLWPQRNHRQIRGSLRTRPSSRSDPPPQRGRT
jgi:glutathione S-transferase